MLILVCRFRQIFPDIVQEGTGHWRYSPGFKAVSDVFSKNCEGYDPYTASDELIQQCEAVYNWGYDLDRDLKNFTSYKDKFPPVSYYDVRIIMSFNTNRHKTRPCTRTTSTPISSSGTLTTR